MKKRLLLRILGGLFCVALALFIWRLDLPSWKKLDVTKLIDQPSPTVVYDSQGTPAGALQGSERREWTDLDRVPQGVQDAFIAAEDLRFYRHHGVDFYRLLGALWRDIRSMSYVQGGSTISQQLIKLTHLTQDKTLARKAQEIVLALQLERVMDKEQILEAYLNAVYFGHGAYGVEAASKVYFGKTVEDLSLAEGALLAGIIKSPSTYAPHINPEKAVARRDRILQIMLDNGFIDREAYEAARNEDLELAENKAATARYAWYMDEVLNESSKALKLSADEILTGGYRIYTGLDVDMQKAAEALFEDASRFPDPAPDGTLAQAALVALNTQDGQINAIIGGRSYEVQRGLNRATQMLRQPGSAFKPVSTYAAAIDAYGYLPSSIVDDTPRSFAGDYTPGNAGGRSYGPVTLRQALSRSLNIATVALADEIGTPALRNYASRFGIDLAPEDANLSMALGSLTYGVSPARLGAAYCALANGGTRVEPHAVIRIQDKDGRILYQAPKADERAVSPQTAYMITDMLKTAAASGSAKALSACTIPVAGKTGTVSDGAEGTRDIWTVAYTPQVAVAVWMGFDQADREHTLPASSGGSGLPAQMSAAFISAISGELDGRDFQRPTSVRVALLDGLALEEEQAVRLSTDRTPESYTVEELFPSDAMPEVFSDNWTAPTAVEDFRLLTGAGEMPVLAFTAQQQGVDYVITRFSNGESVELAALQGQAGQELRFADDTLDLSQEADYVLLPRNALLFQQGEWLTGPQSAAVHYAPGGLLNTIMGIGAVETTPIPTEIDYDPDQSLFD